MMILIYDKNNDSIEIGADGVYDNDSYEVLKVPECFLEEGAIFKKGVLKAIDWIISEFEFEYVRYCDSCYEIEFDGVRECAWCGKVGIKSFNFRSALKSIASGSSDGEVYWLVGQLLASGVIYLGEDIEDYIEASGLLFSEALKRGFGKGLIHQVKHIWDAGSEMRKSNEEVVRLLNQCISLLNSMPREDKESYERSKKLVNEYEELRMKYES